MDIEIGKGKTGRRAYGLDEIAIVPSRRTRDPQDIDISWSLGNLQLDLPCLASALDAAVDIKTAGIIGRLGGLAVLNLEGIQTRYQDPGPVFEEIASLPETKAPRLMQELYAEPIKEELIFRRVQEIKDQGVIAAASLTPQRVERYHRAAIEAGLDVLVIQGTVVSAEHVSKTVEPLNLMEFVPQLNVPVVVGGCASYSTALHLMRTGAVGVLVGIGPGRICTKITGTLEEILIGPAHENDGSLNLMGALRMSMATTGYENRKEFQKAEIMVAPSLHTEGKLEQRSQGVGMG